MQQAHNEPLRRLMSTRTAAALAIALLLFALTSQHFGWLVLLTNSSLDLSIKWHANTQGKPHPDILLIDIDDESLTQLAPQLGAWPWPRSVYAYLLEGLKPYQVQSWVFDILLTEPDLNRPQDDAYWLETLQKQQNVWLSAVLLPSGQGQTWQANQLPSNLPLTRAAQNTAINALWPLGFAQMADRVGLINASADSDGVFRRYPLSYTAASTTALAAADQQHMNSWRFAALPWRVAQALSNPFAKQIQTTSAADDLWLTFQSTAVIPYPRISFAKAFQLALAPPADGAALFRHKVLIIGSSAVGLADLKHTAVAAQQPGMVLLATAIDNLLQGNALQRQSDYWLYLMLIWQLIGLCALYKNTGSFGQFCWQSAGWTLLCACWLAAALPLLLQQGWLLAPGPLSCWLLICVAAFNTLAALREYGQRRYTTTLFGRFLDPRVVERMVGQPELGQADKCRITVLFSDIRGFTSLSEQLDATEVLALLNRYLSMQVATLFAHQATLDKFIGDAIMAFWGAPLPQPQQADLALKAASAMLVNLQQFKQSLPAELQHFDIGIGIHTGDAVVGMLGTLQRLEYTAIGDTVNVASRLESLSKTHGRVLCSDQTKQALHSDFPLLARGQVQLKGRAGTVEIYQLGEP